MPTYEITAPDGGIYEVDAPEGATEAQVLAYAKANYGKAQGAPKAAPKPPAGRPAARPAAQQPAAQQPAARQPGFLSRAARQVGLTARAVGEGVADTVGLVSEPLRYLTDRGYEAVTGRPSPSRPVGHLATQAADAVGLPKPASGTERVVGDTVRAVTGATSVVGGAKQAARATSGAVSQGFTRLAQMPGQQAAAAGTAGATSSQLRESGAPVGAQLGLGMLVGAAVPGAGAQMNRVVRGAARPVRQAVAAPHVSDERIAQEARRAGIDWDALSGKVKQRMRGEMAQALARGGELDPAAVRRLADFAAVPGARPTRGMLTQQPVQITREQSLSRIAANSGDDTLHQLPNLHQGNNAALLKALDDAGAAGAPDAYGAGRQALGALKSFADDRKARIDSLYQRARDSAGREMPLDASHFTRKAGELLDDSMLGDSLPPVVRTRLNEFATGQAPFTVNAAEQFRKRLNKLSAATGDKSVREALRLVRQGLDDTPILHGNAQRMPPRPGMPPVVGDDAVGQEAIRNFDRARRAYAGWARRVEETPALKAAIDGEQPDQFMQRFVTGQGSTAKDVQQMRRALAADPQALGAVRSYVVDHLKRAATGGAVDPAAARFGQKAYNDALQRLGPQKLQALFSPEEVQQLYAIGRAASHMTSQPMGSAVNNSNTGALLLGRGLDMLDSLAMKVPLLGGALGGLKNGVNQYNALNIPASLLMAPPKQSRAGKLLWGGYIGAQDD